MREEKNILIQLLRKSLNLPHEEVNVNSITGETWQKVIDMSFEQGVAAIAAIGLQKCLEDNNKAFLVLDSEEQEDLKYEWFGEILRAEFDFSKHNAILKDLINLLIEQDIKILILKGIGLSIYYPNPQYRALGDIDLYSYGRHFEIDRLISKRQILIDNKSPKHSVFDYYGVFVENHKTYLCSHIFRSDLKVQSFLETLDDDILNEDGYYTPSPLKNYFFLLSHMAHHFSEYESIRVRHILDWGLFLNSEVVNLDLALVREKLREFGLERTNDLFVSLAEKLCGSDFSEIIFERIPEDESRLVIEYIMSEKKREIPEQLFPRIWYKLKLLAGNHWKFRYLPYTMSERIWFSVKMHLLGKGDI